MIQKGDIVTLIIEKVEGKGKSISRLGDMVVFVDKGIPGQKIKAKIIKKKSSFLLATCQNILTKAPDEIVAQCPYFGECGGCVWQNMSYAKQLTIKQQIVHDALKHIARLDMDAVQIKDIIGSPQEWSYRNKIELSFGYSENQSIDIGFRKKGTYNGIIPITSCDIFDKTFEEVIEVIRNWTTKSQQTYFDGRKQPDGLLQYLMIRKTWYTNQWMFNLITQKGEIHNLDTLIQDLHKVLGDNLTSFFHTINSGTVGYAHHNDKVANLLFGEEYITEKISDLSFKISPFSFFQTNTRGAEVLYNVIKDFACIQKNQKILDLFCGTGTIGQYIGYQKDISILGIEIVQEAIQMAKDNMVLNGMKNCQYFCGPSKHILRENMDIFQNIDTVIIDPPRSGMDRSTVKRVLEMQAKKIIYVSCNPATFARDVMMIHEQSDYRLSCVQPVDMFPQTSHVEIVGEFAS